MKKIVAFIFILLTVGAFADWTSGGGVVVATNTAQSFSVPHKGGSVYLKNNGTNRVFVGVGEHLDTNTLASAWKLESGSDYKFTESTFSLLSVATTSGTASVLYNYYGE